MSGAPGRFAHAGRRASDPVPHPARAPADPRSQGRSGAVAGAADWRQRHGDAAAALGRQPARTAGPDAVARRIIRQLGRGGRLGAICSNGWSQLQAGRSETCGCTGTPKPRPDPGGRGARLHDRRGCVFAAGADQPDTRDGGDAARARAGAHHSGAGRAGRDGGQRAHGRRSG